MIAEPRTMQPLPGIVSCMTSGSVSASCRQRRAIAFADATSGRSAPTRTRLPLLNSRNTSCRTSSAIPSLPRCGSCAESGVPAPASAQDRLFLREVELRKIRHLHAGRQVARGAEGTGREPSRHARLRRPAALRLALLALARVLRGFGGAALAHAGHHAAELAHHLARLEEAIDELVDLAHGDAGAGRDTHPPGPVDDLRVLSLGRCHAADDRRSPIQILVVDLADGVLHLTHARHHAE